MEVEVNGHKDFDVDNLRTTGSYYLLYAGRLEESEENGKGYSGKDSDY
jgi:hypothetical protein